MGIVFLLIIGIVLWILFACAPAFLARKKGYSFWLFLLLAVFVSFLLALIIVFVLPDKNQTPTKKDRAAVDAALND